MSLAELSAEPLGTKARRSSQSNAQPNGKRRTLRYWTITTDPLKVPENSTWFVMSNLPKALDKEVGNLYGLRTWVEYGFKQCKNHLGWADFRLTHYEQIQRWWDVRRARFG